MSDLPVVLARLLDDLAERPREVTSDLPSWRWSHPDRRIVQGSRRLVDLSTHNTVILDAQHLDYDAPPMVTEELGRAWLKRIHLEQRPRSGVASKRVPWQRAQLDMTKWTHPRWWNRDEPYTSPELAYVDIVACYPSIYVPLALDVSYNPDRPSLGIGRFSFIGADEMARIKPAHRALGGIIKSRSMAVLEGGNWVSHDTTAWSRFLCPGLWGVIMHTLHAVARTARDEFGCLMWWCDGGVFTLDQADPFIEWLADAWRLTATVRAQGPGTVYGAPDWRVGEHGTEAAGTKRRPQVRHIMDVPEPAVRLLQATRQSRVR